MTRSWSPSIDASTVGSADPDFVSIADGRRIAVTEYGDPDGTPVVFLHGTPGSRLSAGLFDEPAAAVGVRLIAFDRPGFGRSPPSPDRPATDASTLVTAVLDSLGIETAGLLAFSGGSRHALGAATSSGDRIARVDVVSGATPPEVSQETPRQQRVLATMAGTVPTVLRGLLRGQAWAAGRLGPSLVVDQYTTGDPAESVSDEVAEAVRADFLEALSESRRGTVTELRDAATAWAVDFETLDTEVHLWHGEADTNVPVDDARRLASALDGCHLHSLDDADHLETLLESVPEILDDY